MTLPIYHDLVLALTPVERFRSAGQFRSNDSLELWYLGVAAVAVIVLTLAFVLSRRHQNKISEEKKRKREFFLYYARKSGFSDRQCEILYDMTKWPAVNNLEDIFIMPEAFENMAAYLWEKCLKRYGVDAAKSLQTEILDIKEKLGFDTDGNYNATRRGYMRVRMHRRALISVFPFSFKSNNVSVMTGSQLDEEISLVDEVETVKFRPGKLTELAVTAVAINTNDMIEKGSRVLVIFERNCGCDDEMTSQMQADINGIRSVISNVGIVKRVEKSGDDYKIIVEFINLTAEQINEMISITSAAAREMKNVDSDGDLESSELAGSGVSV